MTNHPEINAYLTRVMGEKWHAATSYKERLCTCGEQYYDMTSHCRNGNTDFFTAAGFFKLWEWCEGQKWWYDFSRYKDGYGGYDFNDALVDKDTFATEVYEFLKGREEMTECPLCNGDGYGTDATDTCPACDGTGEVLR